MTSTAVLGVDPGTAKCGLAVVSREGEVLHRAVVTVEALPEALREIGERYGVAQVALGDRTGARATQAAIREALPAAEVALIAEDRSTEEARRLFWEHHPPRGWRRLVPRGLLVPPRPLDAYAAEVLVRRWLATRG